MQIAFEVRDSLNRPIPEYAHVLDHWGLDDYTRLAKNMLVTLRKAGEWRANSVRFVIADREVGGASLDCDNSI
jgi:hypothetical protein